MGGLIRRISRSQILYVLAILVLIIILGLLIYIYHASGRVEVKETLLVLQDGTVTIEYGESISLKAADYLDASQVAEDVIMQTKVSSDATYETYDTFDEDGNEITATYDYPAVGKYTITLTYEDEEATVGLIVEDTTAPEFINLLDEYTLNEGETLDVGQFSAKDFSTITMTMDDTAVDYQTAGTYVVTLKAADIYDNEATVEIKVIVYIEDEIEEEEEETATSTTSSSNSSSSSSSTSYSTSSSSQNSSSNNTSNTTSSSLSDNTNNEETPSQDDTSSSESNNSETNEEESTENENVNSDEEVSQEVVE